MLIFPDFLIRAAEPISALIGINLVVYLVQFINISPPLTWSAECTILLCSLCDTPLPDDIINQENPCLSIFPIIIFIPIIVDQKQNFTRSSFLSTEVVQAREVQLSFPAYIISTFFLKFYLPIKE